MSDNKAGFIIVLAVIAAGYYLIKQGIATAGQVAQSGVDNVTSPFSAAGDAISGLTNAVGGATDSLGTFLGTELNNLFNFASGEDASPPTPDSNSHLNDSYNNDFLDGINLFERAGGNIFGSAGKSQTVPQNGGSVPLQLSFPNQLYGEEETV